MYIYIIYINIYIHIIIYIHIYYICIYIASIVAYFNQKNTFQHWWSNRKISHRKPGSRACYWGLKEDSITENPKKEHITEKSKEDTITEDHRGDPITGNPREKSVTENPKKNSGASAPSMTFAPRKKFFWLFGDALKIN